MFFKKNKLLCFFVLSFLGATAHASNVPAKVYKYDVNDTIPLSLSSLNINRLLVEGDKISGVDCPIGFCTTNSNRADKSGSVALTLNVSLPFSALVTTVKGNNFTLLITPKATPSVVSTFVPNLQAYGKGVVFDKKFSYPTNLANFTKQMILWSKTKKNIKKYSTHIIDPKTLPKKSFTKSLSIIPQVVFTGGSHSGIIYEVTNNTKKPVSITAAQFYGKGSRSASLEKENLRSKESTLLYIVSGGGTYEL